MERRGAGPPWPRWFRPPARDNISTGLGPGEIGKIIIRRQGRRLPAKSGSDITASMVPALFTYLFGRKFKKFSHFFENFSD